MLVPAQRIVSLLPSATEIVCALGLEDRLVGISHSCDYPESIADRPRLSRSRANLAGLLHFMQTLLNGDPNVASSAAGTIPVDQFQNY